MPPFSAPSSPSWSLVDSVDSASERPEAWRTKRKMSSATGDCVAVRRVRVRGQKQDEEPRQLAELQDSGHPEEGFGVLSEGI